MAMRWSLVFAAAIAVSCGVAQKSKREWLFLMPIQLKVETTDEEAAQLPLIARGTIVSAFDQRNMPTISPVQMQVYERETNVKLANPENWTEEMFAKLAERWKSRYFATVSVVHLESIEGPVPGTGVPPPPGGQLTTIAKIVGSLYDSKEKKYVFENREQTVTLQAGRPGPSEKQVQSERAKAVVEAMQGLFKDFLKKLPLKPAETGSGGGGDAPGA